MSVIGRATYLLVYRMCRHDIWPLETSRKELFEYKAWPTCTCKNGTGFYRLFRLFNINFADVSKGNKFGNQIKVWRISCLVWETHILNWGKGRGVRNDAEVKMFIYHHLEQNTYTILMIHLINISTGPLYGDTFFIFVSHFYFI